MMNKNKFIVLGMFAVMLFSVAFASAATSPNMTISNLNFPTNVNEDTGTFTFTFNITYTGASATQDISFADSTSNFGTVSIPAALSMDGTAGETRTITGTVDGYSSNGGDTMVIRINASAAAGEMDDETTFNVKINEVFNLCENGDVGDLEISDFNIDNLGTGDEDEWNPLDEIEIEVEIENTHNDDSVSDVNVDIFIFDSDDNEVTNDFDFDDDQKDLGRVKEDDQEIATFNIPELPADLDEGRYRIYIRAYSDGDEDIQCVSESSDFNEDTYHEIEYVREEDVAVVVRDNDIEQKIIGTCGEDNIQVSFPVYNIGTDKEESVLVNLYNADLGVDEYISIDDLRSGKRKDVTFFIQIPENAEERSYKMDIFTFFDYDKDDKDKLSEFSYDSNSFEDLDEIWQIPLDVVGCTAPIPSITAILDSAAKVGQELVIKASITNNDNDAGTYFVSVLGTQGWAEAVTITPQSLNLQSGQSGEVIVRLNPMEEGFKTFTIEAARDGETFSQPVSVNIAEADSAFNFGNFDENALYYIVGVLVVLIIIILIVIIAKLSRGRPKEQF